MMLRPTLTQLFWLAVFGVASLALGGCAMQNDAANLAPSASNCSQNSDCPAGQICRAGLCSARGADEATLNFRFIPPSSSDFLPQYRSDVRVRPEDSADFLLKRGVTVSGGQATADGERDGGIRFASGSGLGPDGRLIFRPEGVQDALFLRDTRVTSGRFSARINPGVYALTFVPDARDELPKKSWPAQQFTNNTILSRTILPSSEHVEIKGRLTREVVLPDGDIAPQAVTVANARVYARSMDGGHTTTVVTTDIDGRFSLKAEPATGAYDLFVVAANADSMVPNASFDDAFEATTDGCLSQLSADGSCSQLTVDMGAYPAEPVTVNLQLSASEADAADSSWQGTTVAVSGALGRGEFTHRFSSDADGEVTVELYPADWSIDELRQYTLEVIPPINSPFARTRVDFGGAIDLTAVQSIDVGLKQKVGGTVRDAQGEPIDSATLEFRLSSQGQASSTSGEQRVVSVTTDAYGSYEAWLDQSDYDVLVTPPASSGQPRMYTQLDAGDVSETRPVDFDLARPAVILGSVLGARDATGEDVAGVGEVTVEAYRTVGDQTVVYGQGRTDGSGEFRMVIPSRL